jgi:hypothetical protein
MTSTPEQYKKPLVSRLQELLHADIVLAAFLLTVLLATFFWRAIFLGQAWLPADLVYELDPVWRGHPPAGFTAPGNRLLSDEVYLVYPWQVEIRRALAARRVPLWTTAINNGQPFLGNGQVNLWDPFWLIARLFPLNTSFVVAAMLKLWVGGLATFLLARQLGLGRRGAVLAMVTFAFSGPMIVWLGSISGVAAWLPLLLYFSDRALARQVIASFLLVGLVIACQFYSVHPETSFHILLIWGVFCLARTVTRHGWKIPMLARSLGKMALAFAIGTALSAAVLLPTIEGILNSFILVRRQASASTALLPTILLQWHNWPTLITTILPQFFGTPIDNSFWYPYQNYNEQTFYVGIVPLALGLVTLLAWWRGRRHGAPKSDEANMAQSFSPGFWIGLTLIVMGIAAQLPLFNIVNVLPILKLANQGRLRFVYALGLALLAGHGLDMLAKNHLLGFDTPKKFLKVVVTLAMVSLISIGSAYVGLTLLRSQFITMGRQQAEAMKASDHPMFPYSLDYYYDRVNVRYAQALQLYTAATPEMFLPVGIALAIGGLEWRRRGLKRTTWLDGLVLLTCADLFVIHMRVNPTMPPAQVFPPTEAIQFLEQQPGRFRVGGLYLALMPNTSMVFGLSDVRGYEPVVPWRQATLFNHIEGAFRLNHYAILRSAASPLLDLMNVEYLVADRELGGRWKLAFAEKDSPIRVYRNPDVLPRAFMVYQSEYAANAEAALSRLLDKNFDFRTRVILEGAIPPLSADHEASQVEQARIVEYQPERVMIETNTSKDGILVLTDTYVPGWQARVDGQPAQVYIADYAFRGVRVPAGQHRVEFVYAPASFTIGATVSLAAIVFCAAWTAVIIYRKMRCKFSIT